jgi:hypothetical protein
VISHAFSENETQLLSLMNNQKLFYYSIKQVFINLYFKWESKQTFQNEDK